MLVCVYGTLRRGFGNHRLLANGRMLGECRLDGWEMYSLGDFPAVVPGDGEIVCEVYEIDQAILNRLDHLEGYPNFYNRGLVVTPHGKAWMYYLDTLTGRPRVESGDWSETCV